MITVDAEQKQSIQSVLDIKYATDTGTVVDVKTARI